MGSSEMESSEMGALETGQFEALSALSTVYIFYSHLEIRRIVSMQRLSIRMPMEDLNEQSQ
jgi:hypothetical protein